MIGPEGQVFCPICSKQYKDNNLPRILTMCGHTYCEICISNMITKNISEEEADNGCPFSIQCPEDGAMMKLTVNELKTFPKNLALIKVLEAKKSNSSSFKDESFNLSKIIKKQQIQEDEETTDLISAINECKQSPAPIQTSKEQSSNNNSTLQPKPNQQQSCKTSQTQIQSQKQKQQDQLCLLHQKPLQIVCIRDNKKICSKCAIFGQHKGHQFKSIQQVQKQKNQCYIQILQIFKEKQETEQRMSNEQTQSGLIEILDKKRDFLEKEVRQEFRKLREQITRQEKTVLKRLQETYKNTEKKIKSLLQVEEITLKDFAKWQVQSYQLLKVLEQPDIEPKINALYSKDKKNQKILQKGNQILKKIKDQQKNLVGKVEQILVHLECKKSKKIFEFIPEFIQIIDKPVKVVQQKTFTVMQKQKNMSVSTLLIENCEKEKIGNSNCTIIDTFNHQNNLIDGSPLLQQSLLQVQDSRVASSQSSQNHIKTFNHQIDVRLPLQPNQKIINKNIQQDSVSCSFIHLELDSAKKIPLKTASKAMRDEEQDFLQNSRTTSFLTSRPSLILKKQSGQRPNKRKLKSIKISQKYEKMLDGIYNNTVDTIDLTNAEVGDQTMLQICEFVKCSKARTIKFIRNKLTDSGVQKMIPALSNAQILNLSQNNLTQAVIDIFIKHRHGYLSGLKNLILSQNKIIERKHKLKIDQLRAMNIVVSV